jgi:hypothetical protein
MSNKAITRGLVIINVGLYIPDWNAGGISQELSIPSLKILTVLFHEERRKAISMYA